MTLARLHVRMTHCPSPRRRPFRPCAAACARSTLAAQLAFTKRGKFDHVLIETTGLADPRPIVATFFQEPDIQDQMRLDGVVTLVDAKFAMRHLDEVKPAGVVNEALEQVAFADRLLLSKARACPLFPSLLPL